MRVLFINKFLDKHTIYRVPLGILYLSASLKQAGHQVFIGEPQRENIIDKIKKIRPDIIAYSLRTGFHRYYIDLNKKLKKQFNFFSIFGCPHATFFPEMIKEEGIDCVAQGESEKALVDLANRLANGGDYLQTKNFWFKTKEGFLKNSLRELEQDLDKIPFPDRDLVNYFKEIRLSPIHNFLTSRGCLYNCSYCFNHRLRAMHSGQKYLRRRSVDNVIEEINRVAKNYNLERVLFEDDTFNMDKQWLKEFSLKYPKIPFKCNLRANLADEETIWLLKKYKIKFITENILANPTSSLSDDIETLDLNLVCRPDYANVSLLQPYPRTRVFDIALENNQFNKEDIDDIKSFFRFSPLKISNKTERINLQRIFAIVVAFPFLRRYLDFLIKRRKLTLIFSLGYNVWRPYCLFFKIMPHKLSLKKLYWATKRYLFG